MTLTWIFSEVNFTYDFTGSRRKMVVYQTPAGGSPERVLTKEYHDGYVFYDYPDKADVSYFYVRAAGKLWAIVEKQGNQVKTHYVVSDYLGSIRMLLDENGNVEQEFQYGPWGNITTCCTHRPKEWKRYQFRVRAARSCSPLTLYTDLVPKAGIEPARPNGHMALNHACLPVPAPGQVFQGCEFKHFRHKAPGIYR